MADYHIRVRGRATGPYSFEKLKQLVRSGALKRIHQVTEDGQNWLNAGDIPDLFPVRSASEQDITIAPAPSKVAHAQPPTNDDVWYAIVDGTQEGPLTKNQLRALLSSGQITAETFVWTEGLRDWQAIGSLAAFKTEKATQHRSDEVTATTIMDLVACELAVRSCRWLAFLSIVGLLISISFGTMGVWITAVGATRQYSAGIQTGLLTLVLGIVFAGGWLLLDSFRRKLSRLAQNNDQPSLRAMISSVQSFVVYCSVITIILAAFLLVAVIMVYGFAKANPFSVQ